jgi:membrane protein
MHIKAILFDIDGTLVDSNEAHVEAWQRAFRAEGFEMSRETIREQIGKGGDNLVPSLLPDLPEDIRERLSQAEGEIYRRDYLLDVRPFPGGKEILRAAAAAGQQVILASSASRPEVDHYIGLLDARDILSGTTSKDDVGHSKPCPDIFAAALERSGCRPEEVIVVGDTPYDIEAAHGAGLSAVAVLSGGFSRERLQSSGAIAVYTDVAAILAQYETSPLGTRQSVGA